MARRDFDPFPSFRFVLEIDGIQAAGFSECSGLQMEIKTFDYREGGNNATTLKFPEHLSHGNITLKRGVTISNDLFDWERDIAQGLFTRRPREGAKFAIILKDEAGLESFKRWNLIRAFPVKWSGPDLKANASEIAVESVEIAHEGIRVG